MSPIAEELITGICGIPGGTKGERQAYMALFCFNFDLFCFKIKGGKKSLILLHYSDNLR